MSTEITQNRHKMQPILGAGEPLEKATAAMVMIHGRGASAESILSLVGDIDRPGFAFLAPQAYQNTWYPQSFLQPLDQNEPHLSWALETVAGVLERVAAAGIAPEKTLLFGFSQGACLTLEFTARNAKRYGGILGLSGGLIGPDDLPRHYNGSLHGTPVFLGCSDVDFHVPKERVDFTAATLTNLGATVTERLYPGMGHTINADELSVVREIMAKVA